MGYSNPTEGKEIPEDGLYNHRWELPGNYPFFIVGMIIYRYVDRIGELSLPPIFITYIIMRNIIHVNQLIYTYNQYLLLSRRKIGWLSPKKGKGKLPLFRGNGETVIPIYVDDAARRSSKQLWSQGKGRDYWMNSKTAPKHTNGLVRVVCCKCGNHSSCKTEIFPCCVARLHWDSCTCFEWCSNVKHSTKKHNGKEGHRRKSHGGGTNTGRRGEEGGKTG